jgi:hypothetical protein
MRRIPRPVPLVALAALSVLLAPRVHAQHGSLGPVEGSKQFVSARGILVAPVSRTNVPNLVDIGIVECEGFEHLVLNLAIEMQLPVEPGGAVGAVLIPDVFPYDREFHLVQLLPVAAEISMPIEGGSAFQSAKQVRVEIGFSRYRILLWNSGRTAVTAAVSVWRAKG